MLNSPLVDKALGFVDGAWIGAERTRRIEVRNPATGELLAEVPDMGTKETVAAIDSGVRKLVEGSTQHERLDWLLQIEAVLLKNRAELARVLTAENGKPWVEAQGEVDYSAGFFRYSAVHIDAIAPRTLPENPRGCSWTIHFRPAGVAALLTPWNFPLAMMAKKLAASLAAGCPSIIKPSSKTPLTMVAFFKLLDDHVDIPAGWVHLVVGRAGPIVDTLCEHPAVRVLSFTGSTEIGKQLIAKCTAGVKRLTLELGGNAPFIVFEDADLEAAADALMANKFRVGGQTCVCANRVFVHREAMDAFCEILKHRVSRLQIGNGMNEGVDVGPLIDRAGYDKVRRHVADALAKGAERIAGHDPGAADQPWGCFYPPTVLKNVTAEMACVREETFGPLAPLLVFENEKEIVERANDTEYGLAAYVFTADRAKAERIIPRLQFGHVGYNTGTGPTPEAPFGGMKQSGYGREGGIEAFFDFLEPQTVPESL